MLRGLSLDHSDLTQAQVRQAGVDRIATFGEGRAEGGID